MCRRPFPLLLLSKLLAITPNVVALMAVRDRTHGFGQSRAAADPPQPAEKDSRPFFKPKNAVLTTSVSPAQAKPGETVTFKVTAKLDPGQSHLQLLEVEEARFGPDQNDVRLF